MCVGGKVCRDGLGGSSGCSGARICAGFVVDLWAIVSGLVDVRCLPPPADVRGSRECIEFIYPHMIKYKVI